MSTYSDQGYEQAYEEIESEFGTSESGEPLTHEQYKANLIDFIQTQKLIVDSRLILFPDQSQMMVTQVSSGCGLLF